MSDVKLLVSSALVPYPSGPEIKPRDLIDLEINTTIKKATVLDNNKASLTIKLSDNSIFSIPQSLRSYIAISKHQAETYQPQQQPVYKTKTGYFIKTGDYISITFIDDITLLGTESRKGAKPSYDREHDFPVMPVRHFYKADAVLFGWVGIPNDSNSGFTFYYSTSSHNISIDIHDEKNIIIKKITEEEYRKQQAQMQAEEEIKAKKDALIEKYPYLSDKDDVLDFLIEYTPKTKTPKEICLLISKNPKIFKEYHGLRILPHRKANKNFSPDIKENDSYECNDSYEPVRSQMAVTARRISSLFTPSKSGFKSVEIGASETAPSDTSILNSKGGKKSKKEKHKKRKTQKKKNTKKEQHKNSLNM